MKMVEMMNSKIILRFLNKFTSVTQHSILMSLLV